MMPPMPATHRAVTSPHAPSPIGPYSQAIVAGGLRLCSGQIAIEPVTNEMVGASDVSIQARRVMDNLKAVLETAGTTFDHVTKTTIYLTDLADFGAVNEVYAGYF